jgi:hypothetical protein
MWPARLASQRRPPPGDVDDIDAEVRCLEAAGVTMRDQPYVVHRDGGTELWMSGLEDPDGHHVILMQERAASC